MYCGECPKCITGSIREYAGIEEGKILKCLNCGYQVVSSDFRDAEGGPSDYRLVGKGHITTQIPRV